MKRLVIVAAGWLIAAGLLWSHTPTLVDGSHVRASAAATVDEKAQSEDVRVCSTRYPAGFVESMSTIDAKDKPGLSSGFHPELTVVKKNVWPSGTSLHVRFIGGVDAVKTKVEKIAKKWMQETSGNFRFVFDDSPKAQIRVSFDTSDGSWSYVGNEVEGVLEGNQPTMNFGWLTPTTPDEEYNRVVLHEFGHALGATHEHFNPDITIKWREDVVLEHYKKTNGWDVETVRRNIFFKYPKKAVIHSKFDPDSIMLYAFPAKFTENNVATKWNTKLSEIDKDMMRSLYP